MVSEVLKEIVPFAAGGLGAEGMVGPFARLLIVGLLIAGEIRPVAAGAGRSAGAGGGAGGAIVTTGISSFR
jgi:hypothetical protein